ncbi:hypothetical protein [Vibrio parahaemolyticus]|uniref:hypothetical protein n=1 Tax=Vibrio parahaemolyticus TaxID=670 RepID=UPI00215C0B02|nr:hypothetical protein [Vibrio parahaemolyticus]MCR9645008.1 hypothetical protein [Vibrio parahaemolyticus]MCR9801382.1 hypothetical protein [Vibrio parahaemolyticus]MDF4314265.1 hypothetical protein [Vibrio parahaemolyticus]MDT8847202.1 hypothetical protein [Vibrio parahaemolyticus]MDT8919562.1 hypothetical protein [Vibrio parahaemolyticus]
MAKSPLAKNSKTVKHVRNNKNVVPLLLTIPYKHWKHRESMEFDISHLLHLGTDSNNVKVKSRIPYLRSFCKKANQYVDNGKSIRTVTGLYEVFRAFIAFCDAVNVDPLSEAGYIKYAGNDGELRHQMKIYCPSKKLWEMSHGDELGIKETTATARASALRTALSWCGLPANAWATLHRGFTGERTPVKGYSEDEENVLVTRLSELFFTLAPQLIAAKKENLILPDELPVVIDLGGHQEVISIQTSLKTLNGAPKLVKPTAAFNMAMGAAYHLMCFFTSLNDSNVQNIAHPVTIQTDERDKSLQVIKVLSFKARANKIVDAILTNQSFEVDKRDGVKFIKTLETLSALYGGGDKGSELLFTLNNYEEKSSKFELTQINKHLVAKLNLLSPTRASILPWLRELFYSYRNQHIIKLKKQLDRLGRTVVNKVTRPCSKTTATLGATNSAYCILSCYTDLPFKGILLPLTYSEKDTDGNINVSFKYRNGEANHFSIPSADKALIQDIEQFATELADKQYHKHERLLFKRGHENQAPKDWSGISPISATQMNTWSIQTNEYFISLQSSRWREMTSNHVYSESGAGGVQSILQNRLQTIDEHYANGDPRLNKTIISQALQVVEQLDEDTGLEQAKDMIAARHGIKMLAHDESKKKREEERAKTNPNGIHCNGQQSIADGKNTQRETNNAMKLQLPCAEYDMCHKCQSAKAIDETQSIYKLISFIDVLKEALNLYPNAQEEVHEKIAAFEVTLDGASKNVYDGAMALFNKNGRHPRVSMDHAILALQR